MEAAMSISLRIGELAKQQGLTIKALAARAGVAYNTAHTLATGRATRIDLDTLDRVCAALGVEPGALFDRHIAQEPAVREDTPRGSYEPDQNGARGA
jgi:putative transcriptional regulator